MAVYYSILGPKQGPYLARDAVALIRVLESPDAFRSIGLARGAGSDDDGARLWKITLSDGTELHGRWVVIDREFIPAP